VPAGFSGLLFNNRTVLTLETYVSNVQLFDCAFITTAQVLSQVLQLQMNYACCQSVVSDSCCSRWLDISCGWVVGCTAASLRMQSDPSNKDFEGLSPERAFADYVLANLVLFLAAWNYIG